MNIEHSVISSYCFSHFDFTRAFVLISFHLLLLHDKVAECIRSLSERVHMGK